MNLPQPTDSANLSTESLSDAYALITGEAQHVSTKLRDLLQALLKGEQNLMVELPWQETIRGRTYEVNQIIVHSIENQQVFFSNPLKRGIEQAGVVIEGLDCGPRRTVGPDGVQSMSFEQFKARFESGGKAVLPG